MLFYIIILLEKKGDIEEAEEKIAKLSIHEVEGQEEKAGGKFSEILRKEKFKVNFCNKCREGIYYACCIFEERQSKSKSLLKLCFIGMRVLK